MKTRDESKEIKIEISCEDVGVGKYTAGMLIKSLLDELGESESKIEFHGSIKDPNQYVIKFKEYGVHNSKLEYAEYCKRHNISFSIDILKT